MSRESQPPPHRGRQLLEFGRAAVSAARHADAAQAFSGAAACFISPAALLGGAHAWHGIADVAAATARWEDASAALDRAETSARLGLSGPFEPGDGVEAHLRDALAALLVARADLALRRGDLLGARRRLLAVIAEVRALGPEGGGADLWRFFARLAEREGRWRAAAMSWRRVAREADSAVTRADALVRLTEVLLALDLARQADSRLSDAEEAARDCMDASLLGRVHMARATLRERDGDREGAWERWERALEALDEASVVLQGIARVRMALLAARLRPLEAPFLLKEGLRLLLEGSHPDALGLVHHQIALVALERDNPKVAALAALSAEVARGARSPVTQQIVQRAIEEGATGEVEAMARSVGLAIGEVGTRRGALVLCDQLAARSEPAPGVGELSSPRLVWREGETVREHAVPEGVVTVGSTPDADIPVPADVSVAFRRDGSGVRVRVDPASTQAVLLDGHVIRGEHFLTDGDVLKLGEIELRHVIPAPVRPRRTTPAPAPRSDAPAPPPVQQASPARPAPRASRGRVFGGLFVIGVGALSAVVGAAAGGALVLVFYLS